MNWNTTIYTYCPECPFLLNWYQYQADFIHHKRLRKFTYNVTVTKRVHVKPLSSKLRRKVPCFHQQNINIQNGWTSIHINVHKCLKQFKTFCAAQRPHSDQCRGKRKYMNTKALFKQRLTLTERGNIQARL